MRNTVLHIQAKVLPVIASISVKFREIKEDVDIWKRWTSHFRISYRFRDICLDCRSFINISDWMVQKNIFTEAKFTNDPAWAFCWFYILWCLQICIIKTSGRLKLWFLFPKQCFTFCTTASNHCTMFIFFSFLWSLFDLHTFTSAFEIFKSPW